MRKFFKSIVCVIATIIAVNIAAAEDTSKWVVIDLDTPGNLGVEILYQADNLSDVTHLRVSGEINSSDWITIKNLSSIVELDMGKAVTKSVPASTFRGRSSLSSVILPETLETIGEYAFYRTSLDDVNFPSSVESIDQYAFSESKVKKVIFSEKSRLNSLGNNVFSYCDSLKKVVFYAEAPISAIPHYAFYSCENLSSIDLPESVMSIGSSVFCNCSQLTHIDLPGSLTSIGSSVFSGSALESIVIPQYVNSMGNSVFRNCKNLKEVELPTSLHVITNNNGAPFYECPNIQRVICKSPTPPSTDRQLFPKGITLVVPDFAVPDYKLSTYWLVYDSIVGGAKSDYWDIAAPVSLTNNHRMEGDPSITIREGGSLHISGSAPMPVDRFSMYFNQTGNFSFSQLINASPLMSANKADVTYSIYSGTWYFISLPFDVKVDEIFHSDAVAEYVVRYYDGAERASANATGNSWKDVPAGTVIKAGTGIIIQSNMDGSVTFPCADDGKNTIFNPNSLTVELLANKAESNEHAGWNFVANPYPCYYDMHYSMLSCPITVYNPDNRNYLAYSLIDDDVVLWPNRPFFIQATDDVKEIVFSNIGRQLSSEVTRRADAPSKIRTAADRSLFGITLSGNGFTDAARVVINPEASEDYEISRDASKFFSDNTAIPQIFTISANEEYLAINERDHADGIVRLGFYAPEAGEMSLGLTRADSEVAIYDAETGTTAQLTEGGEYKFMVSDAGFDNTRFSLVLGAGQTTGMDKISDEEHVRVTTNGDVISIYAADGKEVVITTVDGKVLVSETAVSDTMEYTLPCGLYIVKVGGYTSKCLIK